MLGGNLLKDIRMHVSTLLSNCQLQYKPVVLIFFLKTTAKHIPDDLEVELVKEAAILCQKKFEFLFKGKEMTYRWHKVLWNRECCKNIPIFNTFM